VAEESSWRISLKHFTSKRRGSSEEGKKLSRSVKYDVQQNYKILCVTCHVLPFRSMCYYVLSSVVAMELKATKLSDSSTFVVSLD
jgi:hypothetical protein